MDPFILKPISDILELIPDNVYTRQDMVASQPYALIDLSDDEITLIFDTENQFKQLYATIQGLVEGYLEQNILNVSLDESGKMQVLFHGRSFEIPAALEDIYKGNMHALTKLITQNLFAKLISDEDITKAKKAFEIIDRVNIHHSTHPRHDDNPLEPVIFIAEHRVNPFIFGVESSMYAKLLPHQYDARIQRLISDIYATIKIKEEINNYKATLESQIESLSKHELLFKKEKISLLRKALAALEEFKSTRDITTLNQNLYNVNNKASRFAKTDDATIHKLFEVIINDIKRITDDSSSQVKNNAVSKQSESALILVMSLLKQLEAQIDKVSNKGIGNKDPKMEVLAEAILALKTYQQDSDYEELVENLTIAHKHAEEIPHAGLKNKMFGSSSTTATVIGNVLNDVKEKMKNPDLEQKEAPLTRARRG